MQGARSSDENVNVHGIAHLFSLHVTLAVPPGPALARLACTPMTQMWLEKLEWAATCEVSERTLRHHQLKLVHFDINPPAKTPQATLKGLFHGAMRLSGEGKPASAIASGSAARSQAAMKEAPVNMKQR